MFLASWIQFGDQCLPGLSELLPSASGPHLCFVIKHLILHKRKVGENPQLSFNWNGTVLSLLCRYNAAVDGVVGKFSRTANLAFWFHTVFRR